MTVADARAGDTISVANAGDDLGDLDFTSDHCTEYEAGQRRWSELSGTYRNRRVYVRLRRDEEIEAAAALDGRKYSLADLDVSEDDLAQMDERQNPEDRVEFDGKDWLFRWSREVTAYRDGAQGALGFYGWEFQQEDGKRLILVRKPEGEAFSVTVYTRIDPGDITVYRR